MIVSEVETFCISIVMDNLPSTKPSQIFLWMPEIEKNEHKYK